MPKKTVDLERSATIRSDDPDWRTALARKEFERFHIWVEADEKGRLSYCAAELPPLKAGAEDYDYDFWKWDERVIPKRSLDKTPNAKETVDAEDTEETGGEAGDRTLAGSVAQLSRERLA